MSWQLLMSVIPFLGLVGILAVYERRGAKKEIERKKQAEKAIEPAVQITNDLYAQKYGRSSPELVREFPELKVIR